MNATERADIAIHARFVDETKAGIAKTRAEMGGLGDDVGLKLGKANDSARSLDNTLASMPSRGGRGLAGISANTLKLAAGLGAAVAAGKQLFDGMMESVNSADEIGKLSDRLGASTEALSEYRHVAELSGVTFQTLTMGWQRMTRRIAEAAQNKGEAKDALKELRLEAVAINQLAPEQQFEILADALSRVENEADRVRLAMKLFDSEGVSLIQTMRDGAAGIREMRSEARELGLTLSAEAVRGAEDARDAVGRLSAAWAGLRQEVAVAVAPDLAEMASEATELAKSWGVARDAAMRFKEAGVALADVSGQGPEMERLRKEWEGLNSTPLFMGREVGMKRDIEQFLEDYEAVLDRADAARERYASVWDVGFMPPAPHQAANWDDGATRAGRIETAALELANEADAVAKMNAALKTHVDAFSEQNYEAARRAEEHIARMREAAENQAVYDALIPLDSELEGVKKNLKDLGDEGGRQFDDIAYAAQGAAMQLSDSFAAAITGTKGQLLDLGMVARSLFGALFMRGITAIPVVGDFLAGRAAGGPVSAGQTYLVGERGPELLHMGASSGHITPNHKLAAAVAGPQVPAQTINVTANVNLPRGSLIQADNPIVIRRIAEVVNETIENSIRRTYRSRSNG